MKQYILVFLLLPFFISCGDLESLKPKQTAIGMPNQLVVVLSDKKQKSPLQDTLQHYYGGPFPLLPQPEPVFDLKYFTPHEILINSVRRTLRAYLVPFTVEDLEKNQNLRKLVRQHLSDDILPQGKARTIKLREDIYAENQIFIYLIAQSEKDLKELVRESFGRVSDYLDAYNKEQILSKILIRGEDQKIKNVLTDSFGIRIPVPEAYQIAVINDTLLWVREDRRKSILNIIVHTQPYTDTAQFSKSHILELQDSLGKFVTTSIEGSYMTYNDVDLPVVAYHRIIGDSKVIETRGIWEMTGDFSGGPYVTHLIHDDKNDRLVFLYGFILAPGEEKRDLLQELIYIFSEFEWK